MKRIHDNKCFQNQILYQQNEQQINYLYCANYINQNKMGKKAIKHPTPIKKQQSYGSEQQIDEEQTPNSTLKNLFSEKGRQDNSLSVLTKKFIELIKQRQDYTIDLNEAVTKLNVQKRRIYDITNVLQGINYVQKLQKNTIKWIGGNESPEIEKDIDELKRKYDQLTQEQKRLDQSIEELNKQIKTDFLQNEDMRQYHYITYEDCLNICKAMNKTDQTKSLIIVSAPKGTQLEAMSVDEGCNIKMDSNGKGPMKVYACQQKTGVKELQPSRD